MEPQLCTLAGLEYQLTRKAVKNINLRVRQDGTVAVSAPHRLPQQEIDRFMAAHLAWIVSAQQKINRRSQQPPLPSKEECLALFEPISDRIYPAFAQVLGGEPPQLVVRDMSSRWGVCHLQKKRITLARQLAVQPLEAVEYVILHEYCHFVHPHHQPPFWQLVARFMPDYACRRALLRQ